jgi:DNA polymerase-3 subunit gamma/tau
MTEPSPSPYRVLARKYRPTTFDTLIGQDVLVRTLGNAFASGRVAQAYLLTGVRGIGKTTTARIIARALNCVGVDGTLDRPTALPCGQCDPCRAIAEDRHVDVLEMDAASRTGIDDVRELIDGARYLPASARYKVYIIDEIHMLSEKAFNALLKTLEEPPPHVRFVFATTEARKVPVTVLSRCQRFDLRRVDADVLAEHFTRIAAAENARVSDGAIRLIARAADGSVRDGLSLLDQAIAHGDGTVDEDAVRAMLGLADRTNVFDLLEATLAGRPADALVELRRQYDAGVDPLIVLQDLLELVHWLTRVKVVPAAAQDIAVPEAERVRGGAMAAALSMPVLARAWQMLLKGLAEARQAPSALGAAEMVLVRLAYVADLPPPGALAGAVAGGEGTARPAPRKAETPAARPAPVASGAAAAVAHAASAAPRENTAPAPDGAPTSFADLVARAEAAREGILAGLFRRYVRLIRFEPGRIEFSPADGAPGDLAQQLGARLEHWTGTRWAVVAGTGTGSPTLNEQAAEAEARRRAEAAADPLIAAALAAFPGATITAIRPRPANEPPGDEGS